LLARLGRGLGGCGFCGRGLRGSGGEVLGV
jgi:hypothetical protein